MCASGLFLAPTVGKPSLAAGKCPHYLYLSLSAGARGFTLLSLEVADQYNLRTLADASDHRFDFVRRELLGLVENEEGHPESFWAEALRSG